MTQFNGKWKLTSSDKFDEYMKALDVGMVTRTMANKATPVQEITINGNEFDIKTVTTFKTTEIKGTFGQEFDETTADGREVKTTMNMDGDKLVQKQTGKKSTTLTREVSGDELTMTLVVDDLVCVRKYKRSD